MGWLLSRWTSVWSCLAHRVLQLASRAVDLVALFYCGSPITASRGDDGADKGSFSILFAVCGNRVLARDSRNRVLAGDICNRVLAMYSCNKVLADILGNQILAL